MRQLTAALVLVACVGSGPAPESPSREESWHPEQIDDVVLAGDGFVLPATLELPATAAPIGCVVFFAGSGPTDRDWRSPLAPGPGTGELLAAALRERDIGSLRYDKVGSAGNDRGLGRLSLDHYRDEGVLAFETLDDRPECGRVFVLGNSEGAIHALRTAAAKSSDPALGGVITLAAPAEPLIDELLDQIWAAELERGAERDRLARLLADFRAAARRGGPRPKLGGIEALGRLWRSLDHPTNARVARQLLFADPLEAAAAYRGSALILDAPTDARLNRADPWQRRRSRRRVQTGEQGARLLEALGEPAPGAVRRREIIGDADGLFASGGELAPGTADAIASFIAAVSR